MLQIIINYRLFNILLYNGNIIDIQKNNDNKIFIEYIEYNG